MYVCVCVLQPEFGVLLNAASTGDGSSHIIGVGPDNFVIDFKRSLDDAHLQRHLDDFQHLVHDIHSRTREDEETRDAETVYGKLSTGSSWFRFALQALLLTLLLVFVWAITSTGYLPYALFGMAICSILMNIDWFMPRFGK